MASEVRKRGCVPRVIAVLLAACCLLPLPLLDDGHCAHDDGARGRKSGDSVTVPPRLCQMFDVLANFGGIKGCNDPTFCGPDQAAQHKDAYSGNSYAFIQSGHYRQILCGAHGVPGGMFGNCQIKKARDE